MSLISFSSLNLYRLSIDESKLSSTATSKVTSTETITNIVNLTSDDLISTSQVTLTVESTRTKTLTEKSNLTSTFIQTTTSISTTTATTFITISNNYSPSISLVSIREGKAVSWDKTDLNLLLRNSTVEINDEDVNLAIAVGISLDQWRKSISSYSEYNPQFTYLEKISITVYVDGINNTLLTENPDIEIIFQNQLKSSLLGETQLLITNTNYIDNAEVYISVKNLSSRGILNILTHEFGHVLGLEHSDEPADLMYSERDRGEVKDILMCPSNLDLYALAKLYQWVNEGKYISYRGDFITLPDNEIFEVIACSVPN